MPLVRIEADGEIVGDFTDFPAIAKAYAEACVNGSNPVCRDIVLACKRYLKMLEMAEDPANPFIYSPAHVIDYCSFAEKFEHFESGLWELTQIGANGKPDKSIRLEPWQIWTESAIHGFRKRHTKERLVSTALEVVPRKNAKSLKLTIAAFYDLCISGTMNAEIPVAASSERQALETIFGDMVGMANANPDLIEEYKLEVLSKSISNENGGIFLLTANGQKWDGLNPSLAIFEEGHAGSQSVWDVIESAFGARPNALRRMITTAGYKPEGPAYDLILHARNVLEGKAEDWTFFAAIYTLDREDYIDKETNAINWSKLLGDERLVMKANPMYGVSLDPDKIMAAVNEAITRPDKRGELARARFNIWTAAGLALIDEPAWAACFRKNLSIYDFIGQPCWIGVDLAEVLDMCAVSIIFELPGPKPDYPILAVFSKFFLPRESPTARDPQLADSIRQWAEAGHLILTDGALADHDRVRAYVDECIGAFQVKVIACDPKQAHNTIHKLWDDGRPVMSYPNSASTMTGPTDDFIGRIATQNLWHDGNPVLAWNATNVFGERRGNGSIMPRKQTEHSKRKIDGFVAACFANGCRMQPQFASEPKGVDNGPQSAYSENRPIIGGE